MTMKARLVPLALLLAVLLLPACGLSLLPARGLAADADFSGYATIGGHVLFFGFLPEGDGTTQCGLWTVDPLSGAAERLAELCPDSGGSASVPLRWLATSSTIGYLSGPDGRLWRTDGTAAGTFVLGAVTVGGDPHDPPALGPDGRSLFFQGCTADHGCEPWRSDGSQAGTYLLRDLAPGSASSFPAGFLRDGRRVVFAVVGALWSTDGTGPGTVRLTPILAGGHPQLLLGKPQPYAGKLYFFASSTAVGLMDLWVYDPQSPRSLQARRLHGFSYDFQGHAGATFAAVGGRLLITPFDDNADSQSLWEVTDTRVGLARIGPFSSLAPPQEAGGRIVFAAARGSEPSRLWVLAPGAKRPLPLAGCPGGGPVPDTGLVPAAEVNGHLFFPGRDAAHGLELWITDGTAAGTRLVKDLCPGPCDGGPVQMRPALGEVVFTDPQGFLWASDGTAAGTVRLADTGAVPPPFFRAPPLDLTEADGRIVFTALDPAAGRQPFASDLTPEGTHLLAQPH